MTRLTHFTIFAAAALIAAVLLLTPQFTVTVQARQSGMNAATAKLLFGDLLDFGCEPALRRAPSGTGFIVSVNMGAGGCNPTAGQVNTFATNRSVTAIVFAVEFR